MNRLVLLSCILAFLPLIVFAQNKQGKEVLSYADHMPSFKGDINEFIAKNIHYPKAARKDAVQGEVVFNFVVNEDGTITDIKVVKGIGGGCDEAAEKGLKRMPPWSPGTQEGKAVKVRYTLPIDFTVNSEPNIYVPKREPQAFTYVEQMPVFPGDMGEYFLKNIKYPDKAAKDGIPKRVLVNFVVNEDGSISDVKIFRGIGDGYDEEAMRVIKAMPKWTPGKQKGKAVKVVYTLPVVFK